MKEKEVHEFVMKLSCRKHLGELRKLDRELTEEEHKLCSEYEMEIECTSYIGLPDLFKEEYMDENKSIKDYLFDHAPKNNIYYDRKVVSFWTPFGISGIDSWFSKKIQSNNYDKELLVKMIRRNPHLSNCIKTNLLSNIKNITTC